MAHVGLIYCAFLINPTCLLLDGAGQCVRFAGGGREEGTQTGQGSRQTEQQTARLRGTKDSINISQV